MNNITEKKNIIFLCFTNQIISSRIIKKNVLNCVLAVKPIMENNRKTTATIIIATIMTAATTQ